MSQQNTSRKQLLSETVAALELNNSGELHDYMEPFERAIEAVVSTDPKRPVSVIISVDSSNHPAQWAVKWTDRACTNHLAHFEIGDLKLEPEQFANKVLGHNPEPAINRHLDEGLNYGH